MTLVFVRSLLFHRSLPSCRSFYSVSLPSLQEVSSCSLEPTVSVSVKPQHSSADACQPFGEMPARNRVDWNNSILAYNKKSQYRRAVVAFADMRAHGVAPCNITLGTILPSCVGLGNVELGKQVYTLVVKSGFLGDGYICSGMISLLSKAGQLDEALRVFEEGGEGNVVCWNTCIASAVRGGDNDLALEMFSDMMNGACLPNEFTLSSVLQACAASADLLFGKAVHAVLIRCNQGRDAVVATALVDLYAKCGYVDKAMIVFWSMSGHNVVTWTAAISGLVQNREHVEAVMLFREMVKSGMPINEYTLTSIFLACSSALMACETGQIHGMVVKTTLQSNPAVQGALISTYASLGDFILAEKVCKEGNATMNPSIWSALVCGISDQSLIGSVEALKRMLYQGLRLDRKCCCSLFSNADSLDLGRQMHCAAMKHGLVHDDIVLTTALSGMYSRCGAVEDGMKIFEEMEGKDTISWTSMISNFTKLKRPAEAFKLFHGFVHEGMKPDEVVLSTLLSACETPLLLLKGKEIHGYAIRSFKTAAPMSHFLVPMYSSCGSILLAKKVFNQSSRKDELLGSYMISGYASNGCGGEALLLLQQMLACGLQIDQYTMSSALCACIELGWMMFGKQLHGRSIKSGVASDLSVSSGLVTMYSKSGTMEDSQKVFDEIETPDLIMWSAMIDGYARHGRGMEALGIFQLMTRSGTKPDSVTFISVLSACSRSGLVEKGIDLYHSMRAVYSFEPEVQHDACLIDMLGRCGRLEEARRLIEDVPLKASSLVWSTLLAACRVHGDSQLAKYAESKIFELGFDSGSDTIRSNIEAGRGNWDEVVKIRKAMGVKKEPGWSSI